MARQCYIWHESGVSANHMKTMAELRSIGFGPIERFTQLSDCTVQMVRTELLLLHFHHVVVRISVDQLDEGIDPRLARRMVYRDRKVLMLLFDFLLLQVEEVAVAILYANIDHIVHRDEVLLSLAISPVFLRLNREVYLILAVWRLRVCRRHSAIVENRDVLEPVFVNVLELGRGFFPQVVQQIGRSGIWRSLESPVFDHRLQRFAD